ncbi:MAG: bacteriochlorophyll 4-vinyl reductase [Chloroflexota bacterium]
MLHNAAAIVETAVIGPNALIQTALAMCGAVGDQCARQILATAGEQMVLDAPPAHMVAEVRFQRLVDALVAALGPTKAASILHDSGRYTAGYVLENRLPKPIQRLLIALSPRLGMPILLSAVRKNAWTFVGGGEFAYCCSPTETTLTVYDAAGHHDVVGAYYHGAFEYLLQQLISPRLTLTAHSMTHPKHHFRYDVHRT